MGEKKKASAATQTSATNARPAVTARMDRGTRCPALQRGRENARRVTPR